MGDIPQKIGLYPRGVSPSLNFKKRRIYMKRKTAILLLLISILNIIIPAQESHRNNYALASSHNYSDINKHWAKGEILKVSALGYMEGSGGANFILIVI